jgi:hypothetical protein
MIVLPLKGGREEIDSARKDRDAFKFPNYYG